MMRVRHDALQRHRIEWPSGLNPTDYPIHSYNERLVRASAEYIWHKLIDATHWPEWYRNAHAVRIITSEPLLERGSQFVWKTFGVTVRSTVLVYEPFSNLGWDALEMLGWNGFHGWKIIPADDGCVVITEEVQRGVAAGLIKGLVEKRLTREHHNWLVGLTP